MPLRWPDGWPNNTLQAMRAAIFAQQAGRAVAFSLAAFRQAFAGGKDLSDVDNVLIAAAACELHPNAVLKGIEMQSTKDRLREATAEAYERGVRGVPTVAVGDQLFWGDDRLEDAAAALCLSASTPTETVGAAVTSANPRGVAIARDSPPGTVRRMATKDDEHRQSDEATAQAATRRGTGPRRSASARSSTTCPTRRPAAPSSRR